MASHSMIQMAATGVTYEMKNWQTDGARRDHIWQGMIRNMQSLVPTTYRDGTHIHANVTNKTSC
jgi:hypothetical protein